MAETFYDVLGVAADASTDRITDAYRDRIKETHPDVSEAENAEERAKKVIEAKEVLTDEDERERYDQLGHNSYVRETSTNASWTSDEATGNDTGTDPTSGAASGGYAASGDTATGTTDYEGGSTWAGRRDWRKHGPAETGGPWRDDESDSSAETGSTRDRRRQSRSTGTDDGGVDNGTATDGVDNATVTDGVGTTGSASTTGQSRASRRQTASNVGGPVGWAAGGSHAVRNEQGPTGVHRGRLFPPGQSMVLLVSTFVCYPSLVFSSLFPPFPLVVNLTVGACTLFLIAYLTSMPEVGVYVFGGWSLLGMLAMILTVTSPFSIVGLIVLGSTWIPLGMAFLTYWVLRW